MALPDDADDLQPSDAILHRADSLLNRYRAGAPRSGDIPMLTEVVAGAVPDGIPVLQDVVEEHPVAAAADPGDPVQGMIRSRLGSDYAADLPPDVAAALDAAIGKVSAELKAGLDGMVRAAVEEAMERVTRKGADGAADDTV